MSSSTAIAPRRWPDPGCLALLSATAVLASTSAASAGQDAGPVVRNGASELRFAGAYEAGKVPVVFIHGLLGRPRPVVGHAGSPLGRTCDPRPIPVPHVPLRQPPVHRGIGYPPRPGAGRGQSAVRPRGARPLASTGSWWWDTAWAAWSPRRHSAPSIVGAPSPLRTWSDGGGPTRAPRVGRYVFIATPHRGAPIDRGAIRSVGSWLARKPQSLLRSRWDAAVERRSARLGAPDPGGAGAGAAPRRVPRSTRSSRPSRIRRPTGRPTVLCPSRVPGWPAHSPRYSSGHTTSASIIPRSSRQSVRSLSSTSRR